MCSSDLLEAFSDGVIAILITIMVLELKTPDGTEWSALRPMLLVFAAYALSFIMVGIYWNNHHHMLHTVKTVTGGSLRSNLHLLFWLSLFPFATGFMGENHFAATPSALYGVVLLGAAIASTFVTPWLAQVFYFAVAASWLIPDKRIERTLEQEQPKP